MPEALVCGIWILGNGAERKVVTRLKVVDRIVSCYQ